MLDLDHPLTEHIFHASAIQDRIRKQIAAIRDSEDPVDRVARFEGIAGTIIPELHRLNVDFFGGDVGIARKLDAIALAAIQQDVELCWQLFHPFADSMGDGDNFGTWAI